MTSHLQMLADVPRFSLIFISLFSLTCFLILHFVLLAHSDLQSSVLYCVTGIYFEDIQILFLSKMPSLLMKQWHAFCPLPNLWIILFSMNESHFFIWKRTYKPVFHEILKTHDSDGKYLLSLYFSFKNEYINKSIYLYIISTNILRQEEEEKGKKH